MITTRRSAAIGAALLIVALSGCDLTTPGPVPDVVQVEPEALHFRSIGAQENLSARLLDTSGEPMPEASFAFESSDPDVATVSATGTVIARGNGEAELRIRSEGITAAVPVRVEQAGALLSVLSGRGQSREIGQGLEPIRLQLTDARGNLAPGVALVGEVVAGGGRLTADTVVTTSDGRAEFLWTLGPAVGPDQAITVRVDPERAAPGSVQTQVRIEANARPGSPAGLELLGPAEVSGHRALPLPEPVRARVLDVFDGPVEGARVVARADGRTIATLESGADGTVSTPWTLGPSLEPQTLVLEVLDGLPDRDLTVELRALPFSTPTRLQALGDPAIARAPASEVDPLRVRLTDQAELPGVDTEVRFRILEGDAAFESASGDPVDPREAAATTDGDGIAASPRVRLPGTPGPSRVEARVPGTDVTVQFTVTAAVPVARVDVVSGAGQTAVEGSILPEPITIQLRDADGWPIEGVPVRFSAERGGVEFPLVVSDVEGRATTRWRLGWGSGPERLRAEADGVVTEVVAQALPFSGGDEDVVTPDPVDPSGYRIQLVFGDGVPASVRPVLRAAADRWEAVVTGDLSPVFLQVQANACANDLPLVGTVDDVMIFVQVLDVDGPGGTAAYAGPCVIRSVGRLPLIGLTVFDVDDLDALVEADLLFDVAVHEFAHVLGFGTLWNLAGLLRNPVDAPDPTIDTHFTGIEARATFDAIGGSAYPGGSRVPVENEFGGPGTLNGHWRWSVFGIELMTGFISAEPSPLSAVTVASFADLGYEVAMEVADPFSLSFEDLLALRRGDPPSRSTGGIDLGDDRHLGPLWVVGPEGEILETLPARRPR